MDVRGFPNSTPSPSGGAYETIQGPLEIIRIGFEGGNGLVTVEAEVHELFDRFDVFVRTRRRESLRLRDGMKVGGILWKMRMRLVRIRLRW